MALMHSTTSGRPEDPPSSYPSLDLLYLPPHLYRHPRQPHRPPSPHHGPLHRAPPLLPSRLRHRLPPRHRRPCPPPHRPPPQPHPQNPDPPPPRGLGHVLNAVGMVVSALVERRTSSIVHAHNASSDAGWTVPMSVLWLVLPMVATGREALHFPAQVAFYFQEFPTSMRSTATGVMACVNDSDQVLREHGGGRSCTEGHELVAG